VMAPETHLLAGDGLIPNNERLPLLVYRSAVAFEPSRPPEEQLRTLFQAHGWRGAWVDGIYPFHHYHATSHEVLGIADGEATVQFGGPRGPTLRLQKGDVVVLPAGVGHCRKDSQAGLLVVGAYPEGQENWDLKRENESDYRQALVQVPRVPLPGSDPVYGDKGPLAALWR
jgi:uncharacterized protein YjlB